MVLLASSSLAGVSWVTIQPGFRGNIFRRDEGHIWCLYDERSRALVFFLEGSSRLEEFSRAILYHVIS
jgi:hypothetical protein